MVNIRSSAGYYWSKNLNFKLDSKFIDISKMPTNRDKIGITH